MKGFLICRLLLMGRFIDRRQFIHGVLYLIWLG